MMIALQGPIRRNVKNAKSSSVQSPPSTTPAGEWIWNGFWAFGSLPPGLDPTTKNNKKAAVAAAAAGARPFVYKFHQVTDASTIDVPSLQQQPQPTKTTPEEDEGDQDDPVTTTEKDTSNDTQEAVDEPNNPLTHSSQDSQLKKDDENKEANLETTPTNTDMGQDSNKEMDSSGQSNKESTMETKIDDVTKMNENEKDESSIAVTDKADEKEKDSQTRKMDENSTNEKKEIDSNMEKEEQTQIEKEEQSKDPVSEQEKEISSTNFEEENSRITFASENPGEKYTDAGLVHSHKCPIGGCWKGYFENVSTRKDRNSSRVQETFYLFFNSTPPSNARVQFSHENEHDDNNPDNVDSTATRLPPNHIHVRGMGVNQFGTFEIIGGFDLETGILNCQRMYVLNMEEPVTEEENTKSSRSSNSSKTVSRMITRKCSQRTRRSFGEMSNYGSAISQSSPSDRPYYTRKRQMNWKRASWGGGYNMADTDNSSKRSLNANVSSSTSLTAKKRARIASEAEISLVGSKGTTSIPGASSYPGNITTSPGKDGKSGQNNSITHITSSSPNSIQKKSNSKDSNKDGTNTPQQSSTFAFLSSEDNNNSTPTKQKKSSKSSNSKNSTYVNGLNSPNTVTGMTLPLAGDPLEARWRAAHYMYYQNKSDSTALDTTNVGSASSNTSTSSQPSPVTTSFVVYEGELNHGKMMRDGFGVCLYDNGTLYEGHWKKNKEHGCGTLFSSDRKKTIYKGDWERGRMHGKGTYYYHMYQPVSTEENDQDGERGGSYSGDFKENARHGNGVYKLPDGSVYDGEWRENQPSGRGTLRWMDGSIYVGMWKDGKRHGQGTLTASDGFTYEGSWINNGMEGRGIAIYPNGQRYEGMWAGGKREGRGTIIFNNGAIYEGRFREDFIEGQGTLKMTSNALIPKGDIVKTDDPKKDAENKTDEPDPVKDSNMGDDMISKNDESKEDWMIPIEFQSDIGHIHEKAGFTTGGE